MILEFRKPLSIEKKEKITFLREELLEKSFEHIRHIVEKYGFDEYNQELESLRDRIENPELKIAIIGDYNTGKSTFINSLLKNQTLSTAGIPTTVIPTYIRWKGEGNEPCITVKFFHDENEYDFKSDYQKLQKKFRFAFHNDVSGIEEITTNNDLIHVVEYVQIVYPYDERFDQLCIIDTPGVNPGAEETKEHASITRDVLRKQADTTLILFPADAMGKRTAFEYIQKNAAHLVQDASFVITKMDMTEGDKDSDKLPQLLKGFVKQHLAVEPEKIYHCSARYALAHFTGRMQAPEYAAQFEQMQSEMLEDIQEKKSKILSERLSAIISEINEKLQDKISEKEADVTEKLELLEQYSLQNFQMEYERSWVVFEQNANSALDSRNTDIDRRLSNIQTSINAGIDRDLQECGGIQALRNYANTGIKTRLDDYEKCVTQEIRKDAAEFDQLYVDYSRDISERLNRYQYNVGQIEEIDRQAEVALSNISSPSSGISANTDTALAGAAIAGIVLLFLNPLVLVGVIGAVLVGGSFVLDAAKHRLIRKIKTGVEQSTAQIAAEWKNSNEKNVCACLERGGRLMTQYEDYYSDIFTKKQEEYAQNKSLLEKEQQTLYWTRIFLLGINEALSIVGQLDKIYEAPEEWVDRLFVFDEEGFDKVEAYFENRGTPEDEEFSGCLNSLYVISAYSVEEFIEMSINT